MKKATKHPQCSKKECMGCSVTPPALSPLVIHNLGASFCKRDEDTLTDKALNKKKFVSAPGGKKPLKKKQNPKDDNDSTKDKKEPKK
jgi:hypothetical protein